MVKIVTRMSSSPSTCNVIVEESLDVNNVDTIVIKKTTEADVRFVCEKCNVTKNLKRHNLPKYGTKFETGNRTKCNSPKK